MEVGVKLTGFYFHVAVQVSLAGEWGVCVSLSSLSHAVCLKTQIFVTLSLSLSHTQTHTHTHTQSVFEISPPACGMSALHTLNAHTHTHTLTQCLSYPC